MAQENEKDLYDEVETPPVTYEVGVKDVNRFIEAILKFFTDKGTLYISSYDFGQCANRLEGFRSAVKVRTKTLFVPPAILENGYTINGEFIAVFLNDCLKNIDATQTLNQFMIFDKGTPLLQCCSNFEVVYVNTEVPQRIINALAKNDIITSWGDRYPINDKNQGTVP
jgi:hypothetical protein